MSEIAKRRVVDRPLALVEICPDVALDFDPRPHVGLRAMPRDGTKWVRLTPKEAHSLAVELIRAARETEVS